MQRLKFAGEGVGVGGCKCIGRDGWPQPSADASAKRPYLAKPSYDIEHVQGPTALGDGNVFQWFNAAELCAHFFWRNDDRPRVTSGK
jgi:hypothetical protein